MSNTDRFLRVRSLLMEASQGDDAPITPETSSRAWDVFNELWFASDCAIDIPEVFINDFGQAELHWLREPGHRLWLDANEDGVGIHYHDGDGRYFQVNYNGDYRVPHAILSVLPFFATQDSEDANV